MASGTRTQRLALRASTPPSRPALEAALLWELENAMSKMNDPDSGMPVPAKDDPYAELFADCKTVEDVLALQAEIERGER